MANQENEDEEELDVEAAMAQLLEYQKEIDGNAQRTVENVKRMIEAHEDLEPGFSAPFAKKYASWYDEVERDLAAAGISCLGSYQDRNAKDKPADKQSFYRFGVSADRTVAATWFLFPAETPVKAVILQTFFDDGSEWATLSGLTPSGVPLPPTHRSERHPADIKMAKLVAKHREQLAKSKSKPHEMDGIKGFLAARDRSEKYEASWRREQGLALFEPMLRHVYGDNYEDLGTPILESIQNNPHWWTGGAPAEPEIDDSPVGDGSVIMMFLMSRDDKTGRGHITTAGLAPRGLPELQMKDLAGNHCRAARFLMNIVARKIAAQPGNRPWPEGPSELTLDQSDVPSRGVSPEVKLGGPVAVQLELEEFVGEGGTLANIFSVMLAKKRADKLLHIKPPPAQAGDKDAWLRDACRSLGLDAPDPLPYTAFEETMAACSTRAVKELPEFRKRLQAGLPEGHTPVIKHGLATTTPGKREFVWISVQEWPAGAFIGKLESEPADCPGFTQGQTMHIKDADVFDRGIYSQAEGPILPALTDTVAQDFGVDIPG